MAPPVLLLVHGAWHGAWCWAPLQAELDSRGIASHAIDMPGHGASPLPLTDMYGDARAVADAATAVGGSVILVGHSYGGVVISEAAHLLAGREEVSVAHMVYVAAFCLDAGESTGSFLASQEDRTTLLNSAMIPRDDGTVVLEPATAARALYNCMSDRQIEAALPRLTPQPRITLGQPVSSAPWREIPSTYVVCEQDLSVNPVHQRVMAARCGDVRSLDTDHSPFASMPTQTADILEGIVRH
ncbi:MAG: hypothetical protein RI939_8 [Actinomycetota bacterium]